MAEDMTRTLTRTLVQEVVDRLRELARRGWNVEWAMSDMKTVSIFLTQKDTHA